MFGIKLILLACSLSPFVEDRTAYIFVTETVIYVESDDFYNIHKRYIHHQYNTKIEPEMMDIWIEAQRLKYKGELYVDDPDCFAAAMYALEGRAVIVVGGRPLLDKMRVKVDQYF